VKKKRFAEEQIAYALAQESSVQTIAEFCRELGVSEQTFYRWKKKFVSMGVAGVRWLKQLEDENAKLKRLVADLSLDKAILQDVLRKKSDSRPAPRAGQVRAGCLLGDEAPGMPRQPPRKADGQRAHRVVQCLPVRGVPERARLRIA
jgi:putative transposase